MSTKRSKASTPKGARVIDSMRQKERGTTGSTARGRVVWLLLPVLLLATLLAYQPAWHGGMLWDDDDHLTRPELRSVQGLYRVWFEVGATVQYYPLLHSVFWIEHKLWGDTTLGYHLVNILLHFIAALLVGLILHRLAIPGAWLAAAIFALHPVHVESVAWITELKNTLSTVFYLGTVMLYLRFNETRRRAFYMGAFGLFVLAMLSKTVTGTLPGALLVIFWWQQGRLSWKKDVLPLVPFFVLGAGGGMITAWWELKFNQCVGPEFAFTFVERILIAGRGVWFHLWKLFWPADLTFIYPRWRINAHEWWQYLFPAGLVALLASLWAIRRRSRAPLAGLLFFCGTLFPVLGFFNLYTFRYSFAANHYQYLASTGIIALASAGAVSMLDRLGLRPAGKFLSGALLVGLAVLTWRQSHQYVDSETLYRATIRNDSSSWMAHNNLSAVLLDSNTEEAMALAQEALRLKPVYAEARNNLGYALQKLGRLEEARAQYLEALRVKPAYPQAHNNLGYLLQQLGRPEEAVPQYLEALKLYRNYAEAHYNLGNALQQMGRLEEAVAQYQETLLLTPRFADARYNLGMALHRLGRQQEAVMEYQEALRLKPEFVEAHNNLGLALQDLGRLEDAVIQYREALRLRPDFAVAHNNLANALQKLGRYHGAVPEANEAPLESKKRTSKTAKTSK